MNLLKMRDLQIRLCLFIFRPIVLKQLNSLKTIDTFSWLGDPEITHPTAVRYVQGSIPGSGKSFLFVLFYVL